MAKVKAESQKLPQHEARPVDAVLRAVPGATKTEADLLLWKCSSFPFCDDETIELQVREALKQGDGTIAGAIAWAEKNDDAYWAAAKQHALSDALKPL